MDDVTKNRKRKKNSVLMIVILALAVVLVFFVSISSGTVIGIVLPLVIAAFVPLIFLYVGIRRIKEIKKGK